MVNVSSSSGGQAPKKVWLREVGDDPNVKFMNRKLDGKETLILRYKGEYYYETPSGWEQVQENPGDNLLTKKSFTRMVTTNSNKEVLPVVSNKTSESTEAGPAESTPVTVNSTPEERQQALESLTSFKSLVSSFNESHGNTEPVDITGKSPEELRDMENGTPVYITRDGGDGKTYKLEGVLMNGMVVRRNEQKSTLGFEHNYTVLSAYDPVAYTNNEEKYNIGQVALLKDAEPEFNVD